MITKLYEEYMNELSVKYDIDFGDETAESILAEYSSPENEIIEIGESGFLMVGKSPNCHPMCDRFICQAYISPHRRGRGLMAETVRGYVKANEGKYCMDIIHGNDYAAFFWEHVFSSLGYERVFLPHVPHGADYCDPWFFSPKVNDDG